MLTEEKRANEALVKRLSNIEEQMSKTNEIENRFKRIDQLDAKSILEQVVAITQEIQINSVHKEEFLDLKAETGDIVSKVNELNVFKQSANQKITDDHYKLIQVEHIQQENTHSVEQHKAEMEKF